MMRKKESMTRGRAWASWAVGVREELSLGFPGFPVCCLPHSIHLQGYQELAPRVLANSLQATGSWGAPSPRAHMCD